MTKQELLDFVTNNPVGTKPPRAPVIRGDLILDGEQISWLPDDLVVTGNLKIEYCHKLRGLPANLFVGGDLRMYLTHHIMIPDDMNVRGDIYAQDMILEIPNGFTVNRNLYLDSGFSWPSQLRQLLRLPHYLTVNGDLSIRNRVIETWPKHLTVKGRLIHNLENCISGVVISGLSR